MPVILSYLIFACKRQDSLTNRSLRQSLAFVLAIRDGSVEQGMESFAGFVAAPEGNKGRALQRKQDHS
jgi:ketosteroid isomerase-like protein